jgi:hypothetical protein
MEFLSDRPVRERSLKPTGWLYPTAYNIDVSARRKPLGSLSWNTGHYFDGTLPYVDGNYAEQNPIPIGSNAENDAIIQALLELKGQRVNLGVALGELQSTANLVGTTAGRIGRAYKSVKRGNFRGALNHLGQAATGRNSTLPKSWLEMQYAWKPLLSDVHGAFQELVFADTAKFRVTARGKWSAKDEGSYVYSSSYGSKRITYQRESGVRVRLDYVPGNTFFSTLSRVGLTNPAEIAWELVPFSFVVDWFSPIGDFLSSLDAAFGWTFMSGSCSTLQRMKGRETPGPPSGYYTSGNFEGRWRRVRLDRKVYLSSPLPSSPGIKNPISLGHAANGLSLLAAVFGGKG